MVRIHIVQLTFDWFGCVIYIIEAGMIFPLVQKKKSFLIPDPVYSYLIIKTSIYMCIYFSQIPFEVFLMERSKIV